MLDQLTDEIKFVAREFDGPFGTIDVLDSLNRFHVERRVPIPVTYPAVQRRLLKLVEIGWIKSKQVKAGGRGDIYVFWLDRRPPQDVVAIEFPNSRMDKELLSSILVPLVDAAAIQPIELKQGYPGYILAHIRLCIWETKSSIVATIVTSDQPPLRRQIFGWFNPEHYRPFKPSDLYAILGDGAKPVSFHFGGKRPDEYELLRSNWLRVMADRDHFFIAAALKDRTFDVGLPTQTLDKQVHMMIRDEMRKIEPL
jgi:hypothetical protein